MSVASKDANEEAVHTVYGMDDRDSPPAVQAARLRFWDAAALIGLVYALTYVLGWVYWQTYYSYFGIRHEFIELSVEQAIATTWHTGAGILLLAALYGFAVPGDIVLKTFAAMAVLGGVLVAAVLPYLAQYFRLSPRVALASMLVMGPVVLAFVYFRQRGRLEESIPRAIQTGAVIPLALALLAACFGVLVTAYTYAATSVAQHVASGERGTVISLQTEWGWESPKGAMLVAHMKGKYFICEPIACCSPQVFIIEDSHARNVVIQAKPR